MEVKEAPDDTNPISWAQVQIEGAQRLFNAWGCAIRDLSISCCGQEWKVHKSQLYMHSDYFRTLLESEFKEAQENHIALDDDHPDAVGAMITYFYTGEYHDLAREGEECSSLALDAHIYILADKYFITPLKQLATMKFSKQCEVEWKLPAFAEAIKLIYDDGPERSAIKEKAVQAAMSHLKELCAKDSEHKGFRDLLLITPRFAVDLLTAMSEGSAKEDANTTKTGKRSVEVILKCPFDGLTFKKNVEIGANSPLQCPAGHDGPLTWWKRHRPSLAGPNEYEVIFKCKDCGTLTKTKLALGDGALVSCRRCGRFCNQNDIQ